jgi:hypothetical protein
VTARPQWNEDEEWNQATSSPGEIFTPEGQIKQAGQFARGLTNDDPRLKPYRRQMWRTGLTIVAIGIAAIVLVSVLAAALG